MDNVHFVRCPYFVFRHVAILMEDGLAQDVEPRGLRIDNHAFLIQNFIKLTPEEAVAINNHMGAFGDNAQAASAAYEAYPLAWLLHVADEAATYIVEKE